uniref:Pentatricopeptide repeat-containing protein n=1 Tax=Cannabis sativa TaxID=3483 RepID=A0A803NHM1_CANSA
MEKHRALEIKLVLLLHRISSMKDVEQVQAFIAKAGLVNYPPLVAKLISLTSVSSWGCVSHAQSLFEETTMDDTLLCNTMIRAYSRSVFPIRALCIYNRMQELNLGSDNFTFNFALRACARAMKRFQEDCRFELAKGAEIHCRILKLGFDRYLNILNSLVFAYSQCGRVGVARQVFDEMSDRSVASWNIMISAYDQLDDFESADHLFALMPQKNVVSWNTLLSRNVRLGKIEAAKELFQEMPERDAVSWNSIIAAYVQAKNYDGALNLFGEMQDSKVEATEVTLISILGACAKTGALDIGTEIHVSLVKKCYKVEGYLGNALVDMYAKCGKLNSAREVFDELKMKPVSCWNAMIVGLAVHGGSEEALELFAEMENRLDEVRPNRVTFIGVLIACRHKGLVEEGRQYFDRMIQQYNIKPDIKHYGCMIDLLSRWGFLYEAYEMIKTRSGETSSVIWRTLLGACTVHRNMDMAEKCFQQLAELDLLKDADYVLLSNIYAEAERWDDVERLRNEMVTAGVVKILGYSHIGEGDFK